MPLLMSSCVVVVVAMVAAINLALPKLRSFPLVRSAIRVGRSGVLLAGLAALRRGRAGRPSRARPAAMAANGLAAVVRFLGRTEEAESLFREAPAMLGAGRGPGHPHAATVRNNLAMLATPPDDETRRWPCSV